MLQTDDAIPQMIHPSAQTENRWEKTAVCEPNAAPKKHLFVPQTQVVLGNFDRQISIGKHGHLSSRHASVFAKLALPKLCGS